MKEDTSNKVPNHVADELSKLLSSAISSYISSVNQYTTVTMDEVLQALMKTYNGILVNAYTTLLQKKINQANNNGKSVKKDN